MATVFDNVPALQGPPDITNALQMLSEGLEMRHERKKEEAKNLLAQTIGGQLSGGDFQGAAGTAFAAGDLTTGLKVHELSLEGKKQFAETVSRYATLADTPEKWEALRGPLTALTNEDPGDFETGRAALLAEFGDLDTILSANDKSVDNARADEQLAIQRERLRIAQAGSGVPKAPAGFERTPDGDLSYEVGGPHDPEVIARETAARQTEKPSRPMPQAAINKLTESGSTYEDFRRLGETFQDRYGGAGAEWVGNVENWIGRNTNLGDTDQAQFWQDYQNQKNLIRNELFGSALTATEKSEFDKANINPGQSAVTIRRNLQRQGAATQRAARKLAGVYIKMGYSAEAVEAAIGMPLAELGPGPDGDLIAAPSSAPSPGLPKVGQVEDGFRFLGGDPRKAESWEPVR